MTTETIKATVTPKFAGAIKQGDKGPQPVAVKRALWHAGNRTGWKTLGDQAIAAEVLGATAVKNLKSFQRVHGLTADGVYGPATHAKLAPFFDDYARSLYSKTKPTIQLPRVFKATHQTAGLPGFPAVDVFAKPGTVVLAPEAGTVTKLSGHDPAAGGTPGGAYGWSIYLTVPHAVYYLTHLGSRTVGVGAKVKAGQPIGTVCDAKVVGSPSSSSHVHEGKHEL